MGRRSSSRCRLRPTGRARVSHSSVRGGGMESDRRPRVDTSAEMRTAARRGDWRGTTGGHCPAFQQANLVVLPKEAAAEFAAFCTRNPKPCPIIEITPPVDPEPARSAPGADLRTDLPGYRVYRKGELAEQ